MEQFVSQFPGFLENNQRHAIGTEELGQALSGGGKEVGERENLEQAGRGRMAISQHCMSSQTG